MRPSLLVLGVLLVWPVPAESHRLDEYLQATRLAFFRDRIVVELDLTPGVSVAPEVFAMVDRDGDARVSAVETETYARRVLQDLTLSVDGEVHPLTLTRAEFPSWDELSDGVGTIRLLASADASLATAGRYRIAYENVHESATGVYLVNALVPSTDGLTLGAPRRDALQHRLDLDVHVGTATETAGWFILPLAALAALLMARRQAAMRRQG